MSGFITAPNSPLSYAIENRYVLAFLKNHPFAVEAFFDASLVLTYAVPKEQLQPFLPPPLQTDTFNDRWAFIAVAVVKTKALRPKGFPEIFGNDFVLTGYRIFVRYTTSSGKRLRGLYILKSETDKKKMAFFGNIFTHYHYGTTDIAFNQSSSHIKVRSLKSGLDIEVAIAEKAALPPGSPFADWKEARRFAGPLPFTFTYNEKKKQMLMIEGVREGWQPNPVDVARHEAAFIESLGLKDVVLANAFLIQHIPYHWKKGKLDSWKP